ncbi:hypothetical protein G4B88_002375 (mitochondrion) [Cannabis sativa]|uniref:Uncharacterized protein n=1 Tax=Cannabis sativa TaxID=3483 RepID=A0A7J6DV42_CANSA|nr:hypothetical protein G4B88_002375 [Cannabis sativa]
MRQCDAAEKRKPLFISKEILELLEHKYDVENLPVSILIDSLLPSRKRLTRYAVRLNSLAPRSIRSEPGEFLSCLAQKLNLFSLEKDYPAARFYTKGQLLSLSRLPLVRLASFGWGPPRGREQTASPIYSIMAGLETSEEDHHLYPAYHDALFVPGNIEMVHYAVLIDKEAQRKKNSQVEEKMLKKGLRVPRSEFTAISKLSIGAVGKISSFCSNRVDGILLLGSPKLAFRVAAPGVIPESSV